MSRKFDRPARQAQPESPETIVLQDDDPEDLLLTI
jgi:hypothetical protein